MSAAQVLRISALCAALGTSLFAAGDLSTYRGFQFGMDLGSAGKHAGTKPAEIRLLHQRPAVIQELDWQPEYTPSSATDQDPVKAGLLSFYNGELSRIVVTYDRYKVEGMSADDMIEAISATYGPATRPGGEIAYHSNYAEAAAVLARWENPEYAYSLVRTGDRSSFAMVLSSKRLDGLAQASIVNAVRLDAIEAPQRAIDLQKKRDEEARLALEKARVVNKPNFHP
jgi:hypothetical protein